MMKQVINKIKCVVIDDEKEACDRLEALLGKISSLDLIAKETNADSGIKTIIELSPEIVFLDVEMPNKSGFDVVREVHETGLQPTFIFVTGYNQYAIKAIRNAAFDYLLKPIDIDELKEAVNRFVRTQKEKQKILLPAKLKSLYKLTDREIEIIKLLLEGKSSQQIAAKLFISKHTVDTHRRNILKKINIKSTTELIPILRNHS